MTVTKKSSCLEISEDNVGQFKKKTVKLLKYLFCYKTWKIAGKDLKPLYKTKFLVALILQKNLKFQVIKWLSMKQKIYFTE